MADVRNTSEPYGSGKSIEPQNVVDLLKNEDYSGARTLLSQEFIRSKDDKDFLEFVGKLTKAAKDADLPAIYIHNGKDAQSIFINDGVVWDTNLLPVRGGFQPGTYDKSFEKAAVEENRELIESGKDPKDLRPFIDDRLAERTGRLFQEHDKVSATHAIRALLNISARQTEHEQKVMLGVADRAIEENNRFNYCLPDVTISFADLNHDGKADELSDVQLKVATMGGTSRSGPRHVYQNIDLYDPIPRKKGTK